MDDKNLSGFKTGDRFWHTLDNAAKIFPAIITREVTSVIRVSAKLTEPVKIDAFRKAVLKAEGRFPYYLMQLRKGFFWYYLEHLPHHIPIELDEGECCRKFEKGGLLLRFWCVKTASVWKCHIFLQMVVEPLIFCERY